MEVASALCTKVTDAGDLNCFLRLTIRKEPISTQVKISPSNSSTCPSIPPYSKRKSTSIDPFLVVPVFHESTLIRPNASIM